MRRRILLLLAVIALSSTACGGSGGIDLDGLLGGDEESGRGKVSDAPGPAPYGSCLGTSPLCESADASYLCPDACAWTDSVCAGTPTPCNEHVDLMGCIEADCDWDSFGPERGEPPCTGIARDCVADDSDYLCAPGCTFTPGSCSAIVDGCANVEYEWACEDSGCVWEE